MLVDGNGVPLLIVVSGANTADSKLLESPLDDMAVERPDPQTVAQHLCLDKGYSGEACSQVAQAHGYELQVPDKEDAKKRKRTPGRWVVEVTHSWINRFRRLLIRWEKRASNYLALLAFACVIICWRKCEV